MAGPRRHAGLRSSIRHDALVVNDRALIDVGLRAPFHTSISSITIGPSGPMARLRRRESSCTPSMDGVGRFPRWLLTGASSPAPRSAALCCLPMRGQLVFGGSRVHYPAQRPCRPPRPVDPQQRDDSRRDRRDPELNSRRFRCTADRAQESETFQTLARDVAPRADKAGFGSNRRVRSFSRTPAPVQVFGRRRGRSVRALGRPASKKRQGAKSRSAGPAAGSRALWGFQCQSASKIDPPFVKGADGSARPGGAGRGCAAGASAVRCRRRWSVRRGF